MVFRLCYHWAINQVGRCNNMADRQSRKFQPTINNPLDKGLSHEVIKARLSELKSLVYHCMADEIGAENQTPHTHIYVKLKSPAKFSRMKKLFPEAHIEAAKGSTAENRDYIQKAGKWANQPKADTAVPNTFEEWGAPPEEPGQGARSDVVELYYDIEAGMSNAKIMAQNPKQAIHANLMDKIRQDIIEDKNRDVFRVVTVIYVFGPTETGKTRSVFEKHGYGNVYRVTDYVHPFDRYSQEPVICFDEFRSSLTIGEMLVFLEGYPLSLPARYANRVACYTTVYIISNIDLKNQYPNVQLGEPATWAAFVRRIHKVVEFRKDGDPIDHGSAQDYIFPPPPPPPVPSWVKELEQDDDYEQLPL